MGPLSGGGRAPLYWSWLQVLGTYVDSVDQERLQREVGSGAGMIAELLPAVRERFPEAQAPVRLDDPQAARFRLFDSVTMFVANAARAAPLVMLLDDLQWSDEASLQLLEFVTRELAELRLLVVGTYRDVEVSRKHPLSKTLAQLTREQLFERAVLRGLSSDHVRRFIELAAGVEPPPALVRAVQGQTEGNPLFVSEVVRLPVQRDELAPQQLARDQRWSLSVPQGVKEVIGQRLNQLSERANEVLAAASVLGRSFTLGQLAPLVPALTEETLLGPLEEARAVIW